MQLQRITEECPSPSPQQPFPTPPHPTPIYYIIMSENYLHQRISWVGGGVWGGSMATYFYDNFYEIHLILHSKRKWKRQFMSEIPDRRANYIHLTVISNQCCVLVILMQEIFPKEKGNLI